MKRFPGPRSVFYRYLAWYVVFVLCVFLCFFPLYLRTLSSARQNSIDLLNTAFAQGVSLLDKSTSNVLYLNNALHSTTLSQAKTYRQGQITNSQHYTFVELQKQLARQSFAMDTVSELLLVFDNHDVILSPVRIYTSIQECFGQYIRMEGYTPDTIYQTITTKRYGKHFLPATKVTRTDVSTGTYLPLLTRLPGESSTIVALYDLREIHTLLGLDEYPFEAFLRIDSTADQTVLYQGAAQQDADYTFLAHSFDTMNISIQIGIPDTFFDVQTASLRNLLSIYLVLAMGIGILLSIASAVHSYRPVHSIASSLPVNVRTPGKEDEYERISSGIQSIYQTNQHLSSTVSALEQSRINHLLIHALHGLLSSQADLRAVQDAVPVLSQPYHLAVIAPAGGIPDGSGAMPAHLMERVAEQYTTVSIAEEQCAVLLPSTQMDVFGKEMTATLCAGSGETPMNAAIGISASCSSVEQLKQALFQALSVLSNVPGSIRHYDPLAQKDNLLAFDFSCVQQLYHILGLGHMEDAQTILDAIGTRVLGTTSEDERAHVMHMLHYLGRLLIKAKKIEGISIVRYRPEHAFAPQFTNIYASLLGIGRIIRDQSDDALSREEQVIQYIDGNFCEPNLYASSIAEYFSISEKTLYRILRSTKNMSCQEYIERLRMNRATELLHTDLSIAEIARHCGFHSDNTFYRVFKKHYSLSPSAFRQQMQKPRPV